VIRPRSVDTNKRLLVSGEKEDFSAEMRVPHCAAIEVPVIEDIQGRGFLKKNFKLPSHYVRYSLLPSDQLENLIDYEPSEADLLWLEKSRLPKTFSNFSPSGLLEQTFVVWENDTNKGQIIPWERALYLLKEQKYLDDSASEEVVKFFDSLFKHWWDQRKVLGRPLIRRFWKSEGISDSQIKIAFQPRSHYKEKRRLRNSKKNDQETLEKVKTKQMKNLLKHFEIMQNLFKGILLRESLKKNRLELIFSAFEQERAEKNCKGVVFRGVEESFVDSSKEFRKSYSFVDSSYIPPLIDPLPLAPPVLERLESEKPVKRPRPEVQVTKKKELGFEIARACCLLIAEGEKSQKWPFIDGTTKGSEAVGGANEINHNSYERTLKMRGRISRAGKRVVIDRFSNNEFQHRWGRYLGLHGVWHSFDAEGFQDEYENDDTEALIRVQKMILQGFRPFTNKIKK
jgi:hypothetical protein